MGSGRVAGRWFVQCPAYRLGPFTERATAARQMAHVEALGACMFDHIIIKEHDGDV